MQARLLTLMVAVLTVVGLVGCYPAVLKSRPAAEIYVTDESGAPIEGATVTLGTTEYHGPVGRTTVESFPTDAQGKVELDSEHAWAMQILLPDGDTSYSWTLCVSKPGFEANPVTQIDFDQPIKVSLYSSAVPSECEWSSIEWAARVKERESRWIEVAGGTWQSNRGITTLMDEEIRDAMDASALEQGIKLHPWSHYRFQYQTRGTGVRDARLLVRAICRAPEGFDLSKAFYSEPDEGACFFETTYTNQTYTDQPESAFGPLQVLDGKG